jgi:hypothetical protein
MGFGIGSILSLAGPVLGALGGGKNTGASQQQISGYQSLPKEIQDYLLKSMFPRIQSYGESSYQGLPMRRINESDMDPVFGSKARIGLQEWRDYQMAQQPQAAAEDATKNADIADVEARMMARQYLSEQSGKKGYGWMNPSLYDDKGLAGVGKYVMAAQKAGGGDMGYVDARQFNPEAADGFDNANIAMMLEAMKRKGMIA